jgi:signal transduction histidine kinase
MNREVIEVVVSDNGSGFKTRPSVPKSRGDRSSSVSGSSAPSGMGLKIMKYRANVIGGSIGITSNERGTVVRCRVSR